MTSAIVLIIGGFLAANALQGFRDKNNFVGYSLAGLSGFLILTGLHII